MEKRYVGKVSAFNNGTQVVISTSYDQKGDTADKITFVAIEFANAFDNKFFDVLNREYEIIFRRR